MIQYKIHSSANKLMDDPILVLISLLYNRNISGPKTVSWGTPDSTLKFSDATPSTIFLVKKQ